MRRAPAPESGRTTSRRALLAAAVAAPAAGFAAALTADAPDPAGRPADGKAPGGPGDVFRPAFPFEGLVTNEYAHGHPDSPDAVLSDDWTVTSGSLFAHWAFGWTGVPDGGSPGPGSVPHTGSSVFRLVTRRRDFGDTAVRFWVFLRPPGATGRTPAQDWDGGHLWLRYRSAQELYALSFRRRDGAVVLKRKYPAPGHSPEEEGLYTTLAAREYAVEYGRWHQVSATVSGCDDDHVRITLALNGRTVLEAEDRTPGRLATPGGVGLRGDNTEMAFFGFTARGGPGPRQCAAPWEGGAHR